MKQDAQLMTNRRDFLKISTMGTAATLLPQNDLIGSPLKNPAQGRRLKKAGSAQNVMLIRQAS
jgi:hypothetical protein